MVARGVLIIVLINVIVTWDVSQCRLVSINHCRESVHEEVCNSIIALSEGALNLFNIVDLFLEDVPLYTLICVDHFIYKTCFASVERFLIKVS